jgi:colicin import membrane protein
MSTAVYHEPYRLPAGLLALAVHGAFFGLLYFGFSWQTQPAATMSVELWDSIPAAPVAAPPQPKVEEVTKPQAEEQAQPDIALPDKKKAEEKPQPKSAAQKPGTSILDRQYALEQAARAEQAAAAGRVVDEYTGRIAAKIRSRIVMPPDVPDDARAVFAVTVLPGGRVLPPRLVKSSGYPAYDNAVERAISKAEPLPLPSDPGLFNRFREMELVFRPKE